MKQVVGRQFNGSTCRFIYFNGYRYNVVSVEDYVGMREFLSGYPTIEGDIYDAVNALNAPLEESRRAHDAFMESVKNQYIAHLFTCEHDNVGMAHTVWAYIGVSPELKAQFPNVKDPKGA